eukprot:4505531-Amphidinium_carterae.1
MGFIYLRSSPELRAFFYDVEDHSGVSCFNPTHNWASREAICSKVSSLSVEISLSIDLVLSIVPCIALIALTRADTLLLPIAAIAAL